MNLKYALDEIVGTVRFESHEGCETDRDYDELTAGAVTEFHRLVATWRSEGFSDREIGYKAAQLALDYVDRKFEFPKLAFPFGNGPIDYVEMARDILGRWGEPQPPTEEDVQTMSKIIQNLTKEVIYRHWWKSLFNWFPYDDQELYLWIRRKIENHETLTRDCLIDVYYALIECQGRIPNASNLVELYMD